MLFSLHVTNSIQCSATLIFEVELVACRPRKGISADDAAGERARLE